mmetsp:Transcript_103768/g.288955  ORF Transcript_103768/g.288955 Transcript_103768/m.288955 type:complete len:271 (-) Transcript_103768:182-994(-)
MSWPKSRASCFTTSSRTRPSSNAAISTPSDVSVRRFPGASGRSCVTPRVLTPITRIFSRSSVRSHKCSSPQSLCKGIGTTSSRSLWIFPTWDLNRCRICFFTTSGSSEWLSRTARATSMPSRCTRSSLRSLRHVSAASRCSLLSWIIWRAMESSGSERCTLQLTFLKLAATMSATISMSVEASNPWPILTRFSVATLCTSGRSKRPRAGHAGTPPVVAQDGPNFCSNGRGSPLGLLGCLRTDSTAEATSAADPTTATKQMACRWRPHLLA